MTKRVRRILAVILLTVTVLLVGYSCFTSSRLANSPDDLDCYKRYVFRSKDGTMVAFTEENVWYGTGEETMLLLDISEYKEGVITMKREEEKYEFMAIDESTLYDMQRKELLIRRGDG